MGKVIDALRLIDKIVLSALKIVDVIVFFGITLIMAANVFVRFVPIASLHWADEIIEMLFASLIFYGSITLWINKEHFSAGDWISGLIKSQRLKNFYRLILEIMILVFLILFL